MDKSKEKKPIILKKIPLTGKAPGHGVFYADDK